MFLLSGVSFPQSTPQSVEPTTVSPQKDGNQGKDRHPGAKVISTNLKSVHTYLNVLFKNFCEVFSNLTMVKCTCSLTEVLSPLYIYFNFALRYK